MSKKTTSLQIVLSSTARTITGTSNGFAVYDSSWVDVVVKVTAVSGTTPTLNVNIQSTEAETPTGATFITVQSIPCINAVGNYRTTITEGLSRHLRVSYAIGGTNPSFTFSIELVKHLVF